MIEIVLPACRSSKAFLYAASMLSIDLTGNGLKRLVFDFLNSQTTSELKWQIIKACM